MFKDVGYNEYAKQLLEQLPKGAFLTTKTDKDTNTMTIGWGNIGFMWKKPIFTVMVRYSRYTYDIIEKNSEFTISIPLKGQLKKELGFCGTKSGRDIDKFKECNLKISKGKVIDTPIIDGCNLYYECRIVHKQTIEPGLLDSLINKKSYSNHDYHVIYYGEILASYIDELK
ncbi:MAG: flavin reductase family protein [Epulopiscium sp.]|nr:flavin reductase family protein [Candidatus Epulonipiscium sp.]